LARERTTSLERLISEKTVKVSAVTDAVVAAVGSCWVCAKALNAQLEIAAEAISEDASRGVLGPDNSGLRRHIL
jgi:hypothetical protein